MVLEITVQETVGGVLHSVAGAEVTVREQTAVSQAVVIETGVSSTSLSDLLMIRDDTEAARADAEASEAAALAHKNAAATSETNAAGSAAAAMASKNAAAVSEANADASEAAAMASKNAAATSETNALAHKNAAASSAAAALSSKNAAATSETNAASSAAAALNSKNAAGTSEVNAKASEAAALASKDAAAASEAAALASKNAAAVSEAAALASKDAAAISEANAKGSEAAALSSKNAASASEAAALASKNAAAISEVNAGGSATSALASKNAAAISEANAGGSATSALASKNAAATSETNALAHKNAAATSAANALSYKNAAEASATAAGDSAAAAALSETNAGGSASAAAASAAQAQKYATIVASALIFRGGWSAAGGVFPTPNLDPETSDYYRITVGGTMTGTQGSITVTAGDYLHWDMDLDRWFKVDAVDAVTSVSGRTGDVTLTKTDVGLGNVKNVDQTNATNITSGTLAVSRLAASVWHAANLPVTTDGVNVTVNNNLYLGGSGFYGGGKKALAMNDHWLRLNPLGEFTAGIYLGNGVTRTDGELQVGDAGSVFRVSPGGDARYGGARFTVGDGTTAEPAGVVVGDLEHYIELRGTSVTYPAKTGVVFHQEGVSTSGLIHANLDSQNGYFDLISDDVNLSVRFGGDEVWNSATGARGSKSAAGTLYDTADWNSFDRHGVYLVQMSTFAGSNGAPPAVYPFGVLTCDVASLDGEQRRVQVYYPHNQDTDKYIYQRMHNAGVWTAWCSIWRGGTDAGSGLVAEKSRQAENTAPIGEGRDLVYGQMGGDDFFRLRVYSDVYDGGGVELATADGGTEPIYVRQYDGVFSSVRRTLTLLDGAGVTRVPIGVDLTGSYGTSWSGQVSNGIMNGNADGSNSTANNMRIASWWGVGISPSVSGQAVPQWEYSHWFDARNGNGGMRGTLAQWSDVRLKTDIVTIPDALAKVNALRGVTYTRKDSGERCTGMIAQEVQAVLPEAVAVGDDENKTLSVAYGNTVGLLVEAIKELTAKVEALEARIAG